MRHNEILDIDRWKCFCDRYVTSAKLSSQYLFLLYWNINTCCVFMKLPSALVYKTLYHEEIIEDTIYYMCKK